MAVIRIDTSEVTSVSNDFTSKANEINSLIVAARRAMDNLRGSFTGNRATQSFGQWDGMQSGLDQANTNLQEAAKILKAAADAFAAADGS